MKAKPKSIAKKRPTAALKALQRAAKKAIELAQRTGTSAYVLRDGKIVDAARQRRKARGHGQRQH